nr:protein PET100 [Ipomoea batatas]
MSSVGTSKGLLEVAKFAVYVTVPIGLMYFFANNTKNLQKFMGTVNLSFYRYFWRIEVSRLAGVHIDNPLTQLHWSLAADFFRRKTLLLNVHKDKRLNETNSSIFTHLSHRLGALSQTCSVPPTLQGFNNQR